MMILDNDINVADPDLWFSVLSGRESFEQHYDTDKLVNYVNYFCRAKTGNPFLK